ncbi:MAG: DNA-binding transcriptional regulator [Alphaproteobacteria bacterium]|nr:DNA-binding transcriptional regulator [Alphaproteobacteria bacterium]
MARRTRRAGKYSSEAMAALHEAAGDLHKAGGIDKVTMRRFDLLCLTRVEELSARQIQALRHRTGVSQSVFARVLNVRPGLVSQWERGERKPSGPSLKLLSLIKSKGIQAVT